MPSFLRLNKLNVFISHFILTYLMRYATFSILFFCDFSYYIHKKVNFLLFAEYGWTDPYCAGFQGAGEFVGLRRAVDSGSNKKI